MPLKTLHDVRKLLLSYQSVIYTRDVEADLILMEEELSMLRELGLLETNDYVACRQILQAEQRKLENNNDE
ncbi:YqgQ family protein [Natribacillus halophilus]|uniref:Uncharacterized protein YqgQ n=1 Tax=Natribacillus halophilus TaxID=549003 RepID=A0A1G8JNF1_9BACI|nr:YqgQ family protein [Natribacillus halophilus]SDI32702.1 Uncharacterized protein YqgQ [Natribacillus halophilus]